MKTVVICFVVMWLLAIASVSAGVAALSGEAWVGLVIFGVLVGMSMLYVTSSGMGGGDGE